MYNLTYIERARGTTGCLTFTSPHLRVEVFPSKEAALQRAREIFELSQISAVELYSSCGEIIYDAEELARGLGASVKRQEPLPEIISLDFPVAARHPGSTRGSA